VNASGRAREPRPRLRKNPCPKSCQIAGVAVLRKWPGRSRAELDLYLTCRRLHHRHHRGPDTSVC